MRVAKLTINKTAAADCSICNKKLGMRNIKYAATHPFNRIKGVGKVLGGWIPWVLNWPLLYIKSAVVYRTSSKPAAPPRIWAVYLYHRLIREIL
jgi:hypothetical protein